MILALGNSLSVRADTVYFAPDAFLREVFHAVPNPAVVWLDNSAQARLTAVLGHRYPQARLRYWRSGKETVWILDEIGKEYPITAGFVVGDDRIERTEVLVYRESRGMEIHLPAFLAQFVGSRLDGDRLSNNIDGITGATISVNAMTRMARAALTLNRIAP
jgi:hypothetical protein